MGTTDMHYKKYLGDLIGGSLMLKESQLIAALLLKEPTQEEWLEEIVNKNLLQKRSDASAKRNAATIRKRLEGMSESYLESIAFGDSEIASQLVLAAILTNSPLLADFMRFVLADAKRMYRESIDVGDWDVFWEERERLFPEFEKMSASSKYKISQVAFKALADGGYIESTRRKRIQNVYLRPEVRHILTDMRKEEVLAAMDLQ